MNHVADLRLRVYAMVDRGGRVVLLSRRRVWPLIAVAHYPRIMRALLARLGAWLHAARGRWPDKDPIVAAVRWAVELLGDWTAWESCR